MAGVLALLVGAVLACAAPPSRAPRAPDPAWEGAQAAAEADPARGEAVLEKYLAAHGDGRHADDAALALAELRATRGDHEGARSVLAEALRSRPRSEHSDEVRLRLALLEREAGRADEAYRVASAIRPSRLPAARRAQAYQLLSEVAASRDDRSGQLRWLGQLASETRSPVEREAANREIDALLGGLDTADLSSLARRLGDAPPADRAWLRLAERHASAGDFEGRAPGRAFLRCSGRESGQGEGQEPGQDQAGLATGGRAVVTHGCLLGDRPRAGGPCREES